MVRKKIEIGDNQITREDAYLLRMRGGVGDGGKGPLLQRNVSGTLTATNDQILFQSIRPLKETTSTNEQADGQCDYVIRRLTPREFERLQGMPDDYTQVPYKGKRVDKCPDYLRYKAVGNSMSVNVMHWIGKRISIVEGILSDNNEHHI